MKKRACHSDFNDVEQRFEAHPTAQHPNEIVDSKADLLASLNQPFDRTVHIFVMCLTEGFEALLERGFHFVFVLCARGCGSDQLCTPVQGENLRA